jgi:transposase-like protein
MARRANKTNENALYNEKQQSIMNEAVKQVMKEGGLKFLTESHLKEAMRLMMAQFINAALQGEMDHHLQEEQKQATAGPVADDAEGDGCKNKRNGSSNKTVHSEMGDMAIQIPRDRNASFTPILLPKHARRFHDFDEAIIDLYSRGMST